MFIAIYSFKTHPGKEAQFVKAWEDLTRLIYQFENSLGSRLHKKAEHHYIAYAQWPNRATWENAGKNLPDSAGEIRALMKSACIEIKTDHELEMTNDLLKSSTFN